MAEALRITDDDSDDWKEDIAPIAFDGIGVPLAPTTVTDDNGYPIGMTKRDEWTGEPLYIPIAPSNVGKVTRGWDDDKGCWQEFEVVWDGGAPESLTHNSPGHCRGRLLPDYQRKAEAFDASPSWQATHGQNRRQSRPNTLDFDPFGDVGDRVADNVVSFNRKGYGNGL